MDLNKIVKDNVMLIIRHNILYKDVYHNVDDELCNGINDTVHINTLNIVWENCLNQLSFSVRIGMNFLPISFKTKSSVLNTFHRI